MKCDPTSEKHVTLLVRPSLGFLSLPRLARQMIATARLATLPATMGIALVSMDGCAPASTTPDKTDDDDQDGQSDGDGDGDIELPGTGGGAGEIDLDGDGIPDLPAAEACGDGILNEDEACDDGNKEDGDGCMGHCLALEPGFTCPKPDEPCQPFAKCGDGVVSFPESCDDGNTTRGDGCSDNCKEEIGFRCSGQPSDCFETTCGDGKIEGAEACEHHPSTLINGQPMPFGGCTVDTCQLEPNCSGASCVSRCGDGIRINEDCDDGNTLDGDGCSADCEVEEGYECNSAPCELYDPDGDGVGECQLRVPVIYRDFNLSFVDMKNDGDDSCPSTAGLVNPTLTAGKPTRANPSPDADCISSDATFEKWYTSASPDNSTIVGELLLFKNGSEGFVNRYGAGGDGLTPAQYNNVDGNPTFFPLDGHPLALTDTRFQAAVPPDFYGGDWNTRSGSHNFHFTSEVLYWFTYEDDMNATLTFLGDDDVWVFLNGKLAVDLGGLHPPLEGSVTINGADITSTSDVAGASAWTASDFNLVDGEVYQIKVFQAERKVVGSSFQLTLAGFDSSRSDCRSMCGDGIIGAGEECDDGVNDGGYNECQKDCVLGGYCGDGIVQAGEACDDADPDRPARCSGCRVLVVK